MGRYITQATANAQVATAAIQSGTAALALNRSINSAANIPSTGKTMIVAQNVKRSKVSTSYARPSKIRGTGVVPPSPNRNVNQNPKSSGRNLRSFDARKTTNGNANISAP